MGKFLKSCLVIGVICVIAGIVLSGAGIFSGGLLQLKEQIENGDWSINVGEVEPFFELEAPEYFNKDEIINVDVENMEEAFASENIHELILKTAGITVELTVHDGQNFEVEESGVQQYQAYAKDHTLYVAAQNKEVRYKQGKVKIAIPKKYLEEAIWKMKIESTACAIDLGELTATDVELKMTAGTISWDKLNTKELEIEMEAGILNGSNTQVLGEADLKVSAGSLTIEGMLGTSTEIEMNAGKMEVTLDEPYESYNYDVSCAGGSVEIGDNKFQGLAKSYELNNQASKDMDIECSVGAVNIMFEN